MATWYHSHISAQLRMLKHKLLILLAYCYFYTATLYFCFYYFCFIFLSMFCFYYFCFVFFFVCSKHNRTDLFKWCKIIEYVTPRMQEPWKKLTLTPHKPQIDFQITFFIWLLAYLGFVNVVLGGWGL